MPTTMLSYNRAGGSRYSPPANPRRLRGRRGTNQTTWGWHQNLAERTRRLWQVRHGQLAGGVTRKRPGGEREWVPFVSNEAEAMARGIIPARRIDR